MAKFSSEGAAAVGANKTILALIAAATVRPKLYDILIGSAATPADKAADFRVRRFTADGTGTGGTVVALDPDDPTGLATTKYGHTAEPTYAGGSLLRFGMNQYTTFRWLAAPGGELIAPATANNGLGLYTASSTGTAAHIATMHWTE